jgi:hypothetical protein
MCRVLVLASLAWLGCASPQKVLDSAHAHELRAIELDRAGRRYDAERERQAAQKQYQKASRRASAYYERQVIRSF